MFGYSNKANAIKKSFNFAGFCTSFDSHSKALNIIAIGWDFKLCLANFLQAIISERRVLLPRAIIHRSKGGSREQRLGRSRPLKSTKVASFTMIFNNSENSIRDKRPFCRPLLCHSSVVEHTSSHFSCISGSAMRPDYQILLKSPPLNLPGWIHPCTRGITNVKCRLQFKRLLGWHK